MFAEVDVAVTEGVLNLSKMGMEGPLNVDWAVVQNNIPPHKAYHS